MIHDDLVLLSMRSVGWASDSAFRRARLGGSFDLKAEELVLERTDDAETPAEGARLPKAAPSGAPPDYNI